MRIRLIPILLVFLTPITLAQAQSPNEDFLAAARKGDVAAVKAQLDKGVDVNTKTQYGATALSYACDRGYVEVVKLLIERGADVNVKDTFYGEVPLGWAVSKGHAEIVRLLLAKGAQGKERALTQASGSGDVEVVKVVLEIGGLKPETLTAALSGATRGKHAEIQELLKKAGAVPGPKPEFQVDAETLKSYVGTYKHQAGDMVFTVKDGKLSGKFGAQDALTYGAFDKTTFTALEFDGIMIKFNLEGDKVVGFTLKQGTFTGEFKKVESK
jgi:hypothetical protein